MIALLYDLPEVAHHIQHKTDAPAENDSSRDVLGALIIKVQYIIIQ